jgi:hypothetical protein
MIRLKRITLALPAALPLAGLLASAQPPADTASLTVTVVNADGSIPALTYPPSVSGARQGGGGLHLPTSEAGHTLTYEEQAVGDYELRQGNNRWCAGVPLANWPDEKQARRLRSIARHALLDG